MDRPAAADRLVGRVRDRCDFLAQNPLIGRARDDLAPGICSFAVDPVIVFCRPTDHGVFVVRVLHGSRDAHRVFGED